MSETVFIYALIDPRNDTIFYVGASINPKHRLRQHRNYEFTGIDLKNMIAFLDACGFDIGIRILEEANEQNRDEREIHWINKCKEEGQPLTNKGYPASVKQQNGREKWRLIKAGHKELLQD